VKNIFIGIIVGLLVGGAAMWGFLRHAATPAATEPEKKAEAKEESRVQHGTNGETYIKLDKIAQEHAGIKVAAPEAVQLAPEVKGFGHVLDPAPLAILITEGASARASLDASTKEYQRLKTLYDQNQSVSTRALEAAEAAMKRDEILAQSAETRLTLILGKTIAEKRNVRSLVDSLVALQTALVRIDLPLGQAMQTPPQDGRLTTLVDESKTVDATYLGPAASADPQTQGQGFLFLVKSNLPPPGAAMTAWLKIPGEAEKGVIIPRAAVLRHEGEGYVYVQTGEGTFQRKEVGMERPVEKGWFIKTGLDPADKVVVVGAQLLLSEELKGQSGGEE